MSVAQDVLTWAGDAWKWIGTTAVAVYGAVLARKGQLRQDRLEKREAERERSDVRVTVRDEMTELASGSYVLTVVVTNHVHHAEHVERVGLWFDDATGIFAGSGWGDGQAASQAVDAEIAPRTNYRWVYDFGKVRFRHGLGYRGFALLATGETVESTHGVADDYSLRVAGLDAWTEPLPPLDRTAAERSGAASDDGGADERSATDD